jgi:hypothetical protein
VAATAAQTTRVRQGAAAARRAAAPVETAAVGRPRARRRLGGGAGGTALSPNGQAGGNAAFGAAGGGGGGGGYNGNGAGAAPPKISGSQMAAAVAPNPVAWRRWRRYAGLRLYKRVHRSSRRFAPRPLLQSAYTVAGGVRGLRNLMLREYCRSRVIFDVSSARRSLPLCARLQTSCCLAANDVQGPRRRHLWLLRAICRNAENPAAARLFSTGRVVSAPAMHARSNMRSIVMFWSAPGHFCLARSAHLATLCGRALRRWHRPCLC